MALNMHTPHPPPQTAFRVRPAAPQVAAVTLSNLQQALARAMADARLAYYRANAPSNRVWKLDWERNELNAAGAEVAFCVLANVMPILTDWGAGKRATADCVLGDGRRVDVKNTDRPDGHLIVPQWQQAGRVELYALMVGVSPGPYRFAGYATAGLVFRDEFLRPAGKGRWLPQDVLCRVLPGRNWT